MDLTEEEIHGNYYNLALIYAGESYNKGNVNFSIEQDIHGKIFVSKWGLETKCPTVEDLSSISREDLTLFNERTLLSQSLMFRIGGFYSSEFLNKLGTEGLGKGIVIYNTDMHKLQVFDGDKWISA